MIFSVLDRFAATEWMFGACRFRSFPERQGSRFRPSAMNKAHFSADRGANCVKSALNRFLARTDGLLEGTSANLNCWELRRSVVGVVTLGLTCTSAAAVT